MDKKQAIKEILMKYTVPVAHLDGIQAADVVNLILKAVEGDQETGGQNDDKRTSDASCG